ncbi:hypothetical protein ES703_108386 [subsurface metagenome]
MLPKPLSNKIFPEIVLLLLVSKNIPYSILPLAVLLVKVLLSEYQIRKPCKLLVAKLPVKVLLLEFLRRKPAILLSAVLFINSPLVTLVK